MPSDNDEVEDIINKGARLREKAKDMILDDGKRTSERDNGPSPASRQLLSIGIDGATLVHLAGKAKQNGILTGYERHAMYSMGRYCMRNGGLTTKQIEFLDKILARAQTLGLHSFPCKNGACSRCDELKDYKPSAALTESTSKKRRVGKKR